MSDHYTAVIKITKTETEESTPPGRAGDPYGTKSENKTVGSREVQEVASLVIRADSIDELTAKATAHLNLVED